MSTVAIQVEGLSKQYRLGTIGTGSLRQDVQRWWTTSIRKKEDPFFNMDSATQQKQALWALQDINFEVHQGEVMGIIGNNGAGKSTLLKIISRIVRPTHGTIRGRGRINSLLEVGTGFQPDLTGRDNIMLSGYILGMSKTEVRAKFDEIVAFAGIERFLDTPVKRYSSGMYVRLAFAVAAHLEPDILILDEVLAVGDYEFQKKCLGKIREVSHHTGRTILFVSHSMQAITNLCDKGMWLHQGKIQKIGQASAVVNEYLVSKQRIQLKQLWDDSTLAPGNERVRMKSVELVPHLLTPDSPLDVRTPLTFKIEFWNLLPGETSLSMGLHLYTYSGECVFDRPTPDSICTQGLIQAECTVPGNFLNDGAYYFSFVITRDTSVDLFRYEECLSFELEDFRGDYNYYGKWMGIVRPNFPFKLTQIGVEKLVG
jgi:lipopolysaccharide transport system ATP-binding protein